MIFENNKAVEEHFGEHLMLDGYGGDFHRLSDKALVYQCVDELPGKIGMHKLTKTILKEAPANDLKDPGGLSAFVMIAESHISVHTFPARGFVSIDFYTCRNGIKVESIVRHFSDCFSLKDVEVNFIKRGSCYPENNIYDIHSGEPLTKQRPIMQRIANIT